jgi:hypothetical protein
MTNLAGHDSHYTELLWLVVSLIGAGAIAVLLVMYRRAAARAEIEEAERVIAEDD